MEEQDKLFGEEGPMGQRALVRRPGDLGSAKKRGGGLQLSSTPVSLSSPEKEIK